MSSESTGQRDACSAQHYTRAALLAFIRDECCAHEHTCINEHLLTGCASCNRLHNELIQTSDTLNHLKHMSRYLHYPELQPQQLWLHMQHRREPLTSALTGKRKRKFQVQNHLAGRRSGVQGSRTGLRVFRVSVPVAFGLFLILTTVAIVLAYTLASFVKLPFSLPGQPTSRFYQGQLNQPTVIGHQPALTPTAVITMTPSPEPTVSPTPTLPPTILPGAKLEICTPALPDSQIVLMCGSGFKRATKVWMDIAYHGMAAPRIIGPYFIDSAGNFKGVVYFPYACKYAPVSVSVVNKTQQPLSLPFTLNARPGCYGPTPQVTPARQS